MRAGPRAAAIEDERGKLTRQIRRGAWLFALIVLLGTMGYQTLGGFGLLDALYMTVITIFTVGYGDTGIDSPGEKIFTIFLIVVGSTSGLYVAGGLVRTLAEGEINRAVGKLMNTRSIENLNGHTIICGFGRIGQILSGELARENEPFVVIDRDESRRVSAEQAGYLTVSGSAEDEDTLRLAGIDRAAVLATVLPDDARNVFITLTARNLNATLKIIARGEQPSTEKKLMQAGANEVVLPASIGAFRISQSITRPTIMEFLGDNHRMVQLSQELRGLGVGIEELILREKDNYIGRSISEFEHEAEANFVVLAVKRKDGEIVQHPGHEFILAEGDSIIVIANVHNLPESVTRHAAAREWV